MPTSTRRQARSQALPDATPAGSEAANQDATEAAIVDQMMMDEEQAGEDEDGEAEEGIGIPPLDNPSTLDLKLTHSPEEQEEEEVEGEESPFPPPGLKEISSLASWTLSTAKPGNGVAALRSPDTNLFWQSDGPQPHLLSIHFFKLVSIVHMRIFLDYRQDESYTPTKVQFWAGTGVHDLVAFAEMGFEAPVGWVDVDFSGVGPVQGEGGEDGDVEGEVDWGKRPVLRAFLVQVRILENHQNGKDTHLRGVQIFARDDAADGGGRVRRSPVKVANALPVRSAGGRKKVEGGIKLAKWMGEPELR